MSNSNKWCTNQCGFKPDHRTEDNLFKINTLYNSYVTMRNKPLYVAFIDFTKFFDTIDRSCLLYEMLKYGITERAYNIIKSMYGNSGYRITVDEYLSPRFVGDVGVKQGCCLSPTLSNIFQNDMHETLDNSSCDPVELGNISFNSLFWADDLVLISSTKNGLQTCLNRLENYCQKWGLEVNVNKTKTMVLSKGNMTASFRINQSSIENVDTYEYLGFQLSSNGSFSRLITDRIDKVTRVSHMVLQALRVDQNVSPRLSLSLFDKQIVPILLYGAEVWSAPRTHNFIYLLNQTGSDNTRCLVQNALNGISDSQIPFVYARRIRKKPKQGSPDLRKILIKLQNYNHKEILMREHKHLFTDYIDNNDSSIENVHNYFCKRSLRVNKYASTSAVKYELGRFPIAHKA